MENPISGIAAINKIGSCYFYVTQSVFCGNILLRVMKCNHNNGGILPSAFTDTSYGFIKSSDVSEVNSHTRRGSQINVLAHLCHMRQRLRTFAIWAVLPLLLTFLLYSIGRKTLYVFL